MTNFIKIIRNASLNPIFLNTLTQNLTQFPQIQACFDAKTLQNFQNDAKTHHDFQNDVNFQQQNSNPSVKKLPHIEKNVLNDENQLTLLYLQHIIQGLFGIFCFFRRH